jgi:fructose-1,6-bisphosphatase/inositol monophosphatase family enzyme
MTFAAGLLDAPVLNLMRRAAQQAILPRFRALGAGEFRDKAIGELVTIADLESEAILSEGLSQILPEATVLGEEAISANPGLASRLGEELCWIIDPLDGTNNFARGEGPFGVMVALAQSGEAIAGWILDPLTDRACHAVRGEGAWIDGRRIQATPSGKDREIVALSSLYGNTENRDALRLHLARHYQVVDIPRCAAAQYPRTAVGENDLTLFGRTLAWDHAAGVVMVAEAGGRVARCDGTPYRVDDDQTGLIVAASPEAWDRFSRALAEFERHANPV